ELLTVDGRTLEGNCDLCFLKSLGQRLALVKARPEAAAWWIRMESLNLARKPGGARFRLHGPGYAELARFAACQRDLFDSSDETIACFCGD
ncbi:MAG: Nin-like protein, partial [Candidatus Accumulibacter sp.]|nr:Nin-like protein [Accumulibacter sp.]